MYGNQPQQKPLEKLEPNPQSVIEDFVEVSVKKLQEVGIKFLGRRDNLEHSGMGAGSMCGPCEGERTLTQPYTHTIDHFA